MPKYMLVIKDDESKTFAQFYNEYAQAEDARMDAEVSLGYYVETYERNVDENGMEYYEFVY